MHQLRGFLALLLLRLRLESSYVLCVHCTLSCGAMLPSTTNGKLLARPPFFPQQSVCFFSLSLLSRDVIISIHHQWSTRRDKRHGDVVKNSWKLSTQNRILIKDSKCSSSVTSFEIVRKTMEMCVFLWDDCPLRIPLTSRIGESFYVTVSLLLSHSIKEEWKGRAFCVSFWTWDLHNTQGRVLSIYEWRMAGINTNCKEATTGSSRTTITILKLVCLPGRIEAQRIYFQRYSPSESQCAKILCRSCVSSSSSENRYFRRRRENLHRILFSIRIICTVLGTLTRIYCTRIESWNLFRLLDHYFFQ